MSRNFYVDGKINPEWLDNQAQAEANSYSSLKKNQLRAFYDELKSISNINFASFDEVLPMIKLIKAKANYRANRKDNKLDPKFKEFLFELIDSIKCERTLKNAKLIFEAIVGFFVESSGGYQGNKPNYNKYDNNRRA